MTAVNPMEFYKDLLKKKVADAYALAVKDGALPEADIVDFDVEVPKERANGEFSTNFSMKKLIDY